MQSEFFGEWAERPMQPLNHTPLINKGIKRPFVLRSVTVYTNDSCRVEMFNTNVVFMWTERKNKLFEYSKAMVIVMFSPTCVYFFERRRI